MDYFEIKKYWGRANSHIGIPLTIVSHTSLLILMLKSFNIFSWTLTILLVLGTIILMIIVGYYDCKNKWYEKENTTNNKHNKELKELLEGIRNGKQAISKRSKT